MRALVIGASGQVGAMLLAALRARGHEATGTYARQAVQGAWPLDIRNAPAVEHAIAFVKPEWVFCPASLTFVDYCEDHPDEAIAVNRDGALHAARMAQRFGAGFVYFSTDYVFDGTQGPYSEEDPPNPLSAYGRSKLEGERAVLEAHRGAVVIRTAWVYGPDGQEKNFVYQLLRNCRSGSPMRIPADQVSSPAYNLDLAAATVELAERGLGGIYHVVGGESLDRYSYARMACDVFGLDPALLNPVATAALGQKAARPLRGGLRIDKARAALTTPLRGPRDGLEAMRRAVESSAGD